MKPNRSVAQWVEEMAQLTQPERIQWLNGSAQEYAQLIEQGLTQKLLIPLNEEKHPGSFLHRSDPRDVARTEQSTFICTPSETEAGPTNNWMAPQEAYGKLTKLFSGIMRGRTMYVIPYLLGPEHSSLSRVGVELTDSVYVAVNMAMMTRMGEAAFQQMGDSSEFIKGLHSIGNLDPKERYICHFPYDRSIWSINSGYGGNALLSKKCAALRIASFLGREEGWLAEHMFIVGIEDPQGRITYIAGALPSACGKTNLAMIRPSGPFKKYKVWCVGDDIAWLRPGADGRLYAVNPEAGFFGVAPGTSLKTNPVMMETISKNAIFTNVGLAPDRTVWWEGLPFPSNTSGFLDWQGQPWDRREKIAQPNSRFTAPIRQCPIYSREWNNPKGVPISAILFGCRRSTLVPLVYESFNWQHGVYLGATLNSETTAAAAGATGVVRRDPMAMLPFCGYNMADYFAHWLEIGKKLSHPPKIYRVNWFRTGSDGKFIWPGFGENMRVLDWIIRRTQEKAQGVKTPLGYVPAEGEIDLTGLSLKKKERDMLFEVNRAGWSEAAQRQTDFFAKFKDRLPSELVREQQELIVRLKEKE